MRHVDLLEDLDPIAGAARQHGGYEVARAVKRKCRRLLPPRDEVRAGGVREMVLDIVDTELEQLFAHL